MRGPSLQAAGRVRAVALDFTLPPELGDLIDRVQAYVEEDALPAAAEIADPADVLASWHVVERLRDRARERGLFTPHLPKAWGGLGVGPLGMALVSQECGVSSARLLTRKAFGRIADRAVQMHGAAGIAMDLPIARIFQDARAARIYDGASEVHRMVVARDMLKLAMGGESVRAACGGL
jgi:alkylation response protein AidB-like acyl-CoA dehydrogenase